MNLEYWNWNWGIFLNENYVCMFKFRFFHIDFEIRITYIMSRMIEAYCIKRER